MSSSGMDSFLKLLVQRQAAGMVGKDAHSTGHDMG